MPNYLDQLNPAQLQAVMHETGPAMVLAGAGSGKTRVLTSRVARLLAEKKALPEEILLVTFTNKAANEMSLRVEALTGFRLPFSGTFHRICALILRKYGHVIGLSNHYVIYDSDDQLQLIKQILQELHYNPKEFKPSAIQGMISNAKNELVSAEEYERIAQGKYQQAAAKAYKKYQFVLQKNNSVDFDDLLLRTLELFQKYPTVAEKFQQQFKYVLVDEYQDTNKAQYQLTRQFSFPQENLFVVGDAAQAIYSWRGADYRNLLQLKEDYPEMKEYRLEQNYRSTQTILDAASAVIANNTTHPVLQLWTESVITSHPIHVYAAIDNRDEAQYIAQTIHRRYHSELEHIAILYRTNAQSRSFEEIFLRQSIPYRIVGGIKFYARKEVKDLLSYLRLVANPNDTVSVERVLKIGKRRYEAFNTWREKLLQIAVELTPLEMLDQILNATAYKDLFDPQDPEDVARLENIEELRAVASEFRELSEFLENVALVDISASSHRDTADRAEHEHEPAVTLMSIHAAKGLEFDTVFVVGLEEGLFPHSRALMSREEMEEERRLCYVGMTRARQYLYLTYAQSRFMYGSHSPSLASRFLSEVPVELTHQQAAERAPEYNSHRFNRYRGTTISYRPAPAISNGFKEPRRVILDDSELDDLLSGEIDVDAWLKK